MRPMSYSRRIALRMYITHMMEGIPAKRLVAKAESFGGFWLRHQQSRLVLRAWRRDYQEALGVLSQP